MMTMMRMVVRMMEEVVVMVQMKLAGITVAMVMEITTLMHITMFDDDEDGVAVVMKEMKIMTAGLVEKNVHHEMMLVMMNMTV